MEVQLPEFVRDAEKLHLAAEEARRDALRNRFQAIAYAMVTRVRECYEQRDRTVFPDDMTIRRWLNATNGGENAGIMVTDPLLIGLVQNARAALCSAHIMQDRIWILALRLNEHIEPHGYTVVLTTEFLDSIQIRYIAVEDGNVD